MSELHDPIDPDNYFIVGKWEITYQEKLAPQVFIKISYNFDKPVKLKDNMPDRYNFISARQID